MTVLKITKFIPRSSDEDIAYQEMQEKMGNLGNLSLSIYAAQRAIPATRNFNFFLNYKIDKTTTVKIIPLNFPKLKQQPKFSINLTLKKRPIVAYLNPQKNLL